MIKYYTYNNGTKWAIRFAGPAFTLTREIENLIRKAPNNWNSEMEAKAWVELNL